MAGQVINDVRTACSFEGIQSATSKRVVIVSSPSSPFFFSSPNHKFQGGKKKKKNKKRKYLQDIEISHIQYGKFSFPNGKFELHRSIYIRTDVNKSELVRDSAFVRVCLLHLGNRSLQRVFID